MSGSKATGNRTWDVTLTLTCDECSATASATGVDITKVGATSDVERSLRYSGWTLRRSKTFCPAHSLPLRECGSCGEPTPSEYAFELTRSGEGLVFRCGPCERAWVTEQAFS